MQNVKSAGGGDDEVPELPKGLVKRSLMGNASSTFKHLSIELEGLSSTTKRPQLNKLKRTKNIAAQALKVLKFVGKDDDATGWPEVEKRFQELTRETNGMLPRDRFGECIGMIKRPRESKEFAHELFDALARRRGIKDGLINLSQLREFWEQMTDQSFDARFQTFFDMVDEDGNGIITKDEVKEIITLSLSTNKLSVSDLKQVENYVELFMEALDPNNLGNIEIENLQNLLLDAQNQAAGIGDRQILSGMLSPKANQLQKLNPIRRWIQDYMYFVIDNWQRVWVMALWIVVMASLFAYKYVQYRNKAVYEVMGVCVCLAKGAAETLKLNMALILLPVCRNTITWLRNMTKLGVVVPFDDNINFHKVIAVAVAIGVGIHGISHLACDFPRLLNASPEKYEPMEPFFGDQPTSYWHFVKGVEGVTGIIMVVLMTIAFTLASPWFRRNKLKLPKPLKKVTGFNAFWYTHHLFVIVYALLIVHGIKLYLTHEWYKKTTWMYVSIPIALYAIERLIRAFRSSIKPSRVLRVDGYPANVLALRISKPEGFKYKSGQYMFVNCSAVSPFEWHPFSITSAPKDDYLSVHIRTLGDWTENLRSVFSEACQTKPSAKSFEGENNPNFPRVLIDGPYGAPAQDYKKYEIVLLIGLGIGATPMISIVKDIVNNVKMNKDEENALEHGMGGSYMPISESKSRKKNKFKTNKAYFYWSTREQGSYDWFHKIMDDIAGSDLEEVIEMYNYCTSVYEEGDVRSAILTMLQSLNYAKNGVDVVSGTRVKSYFARPDWRNVYQNIANKHPGSRVGVFYCGDRVLTEELRKLALDFTHSGSTRFDFHKENF